MPPSEPADASRQRAERIKRLAYTVVRDVHHVGEALESVDVEDLAARIKRVYAGLNAEKEFEAIVSWLGHCKAIHAIEDTGNDDSERILRAPDYLVVTNHNGQQKPFLVEVKATLDEELVWSEKYLSSLRRFADILNLPLLVAWKRGPFWTLTDTTHFALRSTAYHLPFEQAMKENLMTIACGELLITLDADLQFILEGESPDILPPREELITPGTYDIKITDAAFYTKQGRMTTVRSEFFWLYACASDTNHVERPTQQTIRIIHHPEPDQVYPLSRILIAQLAWNRPDDTNIDWNVELRKRPFPSSGSTYRNALQEAIDAGIVHIVGIQQPNTYPAFLAPRSQKE